MKKLNVILLLTLCLFILIVTLTNCNKLENFTANQCYPTQSACLADCVQSFTFTPNTTSNKWVLYNGEVKTDSVPPTLTFTKYPNNIVEVTSSATNTVNDCTGSGWLYFSLTDGTWKQGTVSLSDPPSFISSLMVDKPANGWNPSTRPNLKVTSEFPIILTENIRKLCVAGIAKFTPDDSKPGSPSPFYATCCPSLFFYIAAVGELNNPWLSAGARTTFTIPPFVGRYQSGGD
jgi:hypothetical protein